MDMKTNEFLPYVGMWVIGGTQWVKIYSNYTQTNKTFVLIMFELYKSSIFRLIQCVLILLLNI